MLPSAERLAIANAQAAGRRQLTALVTGFGAFPGMRRNPTQEIIRALAASRRFSRLGLRLETEILPVEFGAIETRLKALLARTNPDIVIHLGVAGQRRWISVETRARNRLSTLRPDARRRHSAQSTITAGARDFLPARWPAAQLRARVLRSGAAGNLSIDAGDYLCNQLLYLTLSLTRIPAGFIHVPRPRAEGPSVAAMTRAIEAAVVMLGAYHRNNP